MSLSQPLVLHRRPPRPTPLRRLRFAAAPAGGAAARALPFPGISVPEPASSRGRVLSGSLAVLLHAGLIAALVIAGMVVPELQEEEVIPVQLLRDIPAAEEEAAPAPKALAERRSINFAPSAQAIAPQVVNPRVIARAAPAVAAEKLELDTVGPLVAPREIKRAAVAVETVEAVTAVGAVQPSRLDVSDAAAPALRGPIERVAPVGPSVGPRRVVTAGDSIGTGTVDLGDGSSVREGIASTRDVLGSPDGPRLASVNTRVGDTHLGGAGGSGTGLGGAAPDCFKRPEVQAYWAQIRDRMYARWALPASLPGGTVEVRLRFQLDPGGSATRVELVPGGDPGLGRSAVDALRSAAPFPPMSDQVRCLAGREITGIFRKRPGAGTASVAN